MRYQGEHHFGGWSRDTSQVNYALAILSWALHTVMGTREDTRWMARIPGDASHLIIETPRVEESTAGDLTWVVVHLLQVVRLTAQLLIGRSGVQMPMGSQQRQGVATFKTAGVQKKKSNCSVSLFRKHTTKRR
jgi:hypothetical protein